MNATLAASRLGNRKVRLLIPVWFRGVVIRECIEEIPRSGSLSPPEAIGNANNGSRIHPPAQLGQDGSSVPGAPHDRLFEKGEEMLFVFGIRSVANLSSRHRTPVRCRCDGDVAERDEMSWRHCSDAFIRSEIVYGLRA